MVNGAFCYVTIFLHMIRHKCVAYISDCDSTLFQNFSEYNFLYRNFASSHLFVHRLASTIIRIWQPVLLAFSIWNGSRNIIFKIFLQVTFSFLLTELDPENVTLVNFPTVRFDWILEISHLPHLWYFFQSENKSDLPWSSSIQFHLMLRSPGEEKRSTRYSNHLLARYLLSFLEER